MPVFLLTSASRSWEMGAEKLHAWHAISAVLLSLELLEAKHDGACLRSTLGRRAAWAT